MSTPAETLAQSLSALRNASRFSGNKNSYRKDNPNEYAKVIAYLDGGARPTGVMQFSLMGQHAVLDEDARRALVPPDPGLPFKEAELRPGYATIRGAGNFGSYPGNPVNGGEDCLIDLEGLQRSAPTTVWTEEGQRVQIHKGRWNGGIGKCGLRIRSVDGIGAEHASATDMRANDSIDAFVPSGNPGSSTLYTLQKIRTEYPSVNVGDGNEHVDAVQVQGDLRRLEIGLATIWLCGVLPANSDPDLGPISSGHRGKGLMLNTVNKTPFEVHLRKVNFRAANLLTGAAIFRDYRAIRLILEDVYVDKQGPAGNVWADGSGLFYPQNWTSTGTPPFATWPATENIQGGVTRGLPPGGDYFP